MQSPEVLKMVERWNSGVAFEDVLEGRRVTAMTVSPIMRSSCLVQFDHDDTEWLLIIPKQLKEIPLMSGLRRLSAPDLRALREIILTVIEEGPSDGEEWDFYSDMVFSGPGSEITPTSNNLRYDFCDAIQQRIFATEPAPERKGSTDAGTDNATDQG